MKKLINQWHCICCVFIVLCVGTTPLFAGSINADHQQNNQKKEFLKWADDVRGGQSDKDFTLTADVDISDISWVPLGDINHPYAGAFDGGGHTITGLRIPEESKAIFAGLFGIIGKRGSVKNVSIADANVITFDRGGGIAGVNDGRIEGCRFSGKLTGEGTRSYVGGIAGINNGQIVACRTENSDLVAFSYVGGITGLNNSNSRIVACCETGGNLTKHRNATRAIVGGIAGGNGGLIIGCLTNPKQIRGYAKGGVVGVNRDGFEVNGCYWYSGKGAGYTSGNGTIEGCFELQEGQRAESAVLNQSIKAWNLRNPDSLVLYEWREDSVHSVY